MTRLPKMKIKEYYRYLYTHTFGNWDEMDTCLKKINLQNIKYGSYIHICPIKIMEFIILHFSKRKSPNADGLTWELNEATENNISSIQSHLKDKRDRNGSNTLWSCYHLKSKTRWTSKPTVVVWIGMAPIGSQSWMLGH